jgi:thiol-disulfide isomerase/thioredoxin
MYSTPYSDASLFTTRQLDFDHDARRPSQGVSTCMIVGGIVVLFYLMTVVNEPRVYPRPKQSLYPHYRNAVSSLRTTVRQLSARSSTVQASKKYKAVGDVHVTLIENKDKKKCGSDFVATLKSHETAIVMIFADWCGHCHKMMPEFGGAADGSKRAAIMVNGDHLPDDIMSGSHEIMDGAVEFFPNLRVWDGQRLLRPDNMSIVSAIQKYDAIVEARKGGGSLAADPPVEPSEIPPLSVRRTHFQYSMNRDPGMLDAGPSKRMADPVATHEDHSFLNDIF